MNLTMPQSPPIRVVAIGASAGAIQALSQILPTLPEDFPLPVLIVVHVPPEQTSALPELFGARCRIAVKEAEDKEKIVPGTAYFAPPNYHLLVETDGTLSLSSDEPELFSRPSINVLFESAADAYGDGLLAIVLTGASSDGAEGLRIACESGATVLIQDPKTAEARAMPLAAAEACPRARTVTLNEIAKALQQFQRRKTNDIQQAH